MKTVLYFDDDALLLTALEQMLAQKDVTVQTFNARLMDPLQHEIIVHDCSLESAPCNRIDGLISDYDYRRGDDVNGMTFLKLFRESRCRKAMTMPLVLVTGGVPESIDMAQFDEDLEQYDIQYEQKPFNTERIILALKAII